MSSIMETIRIVLRGANIGVGLLSENASFYEAWTWSEYIGIA